MICLEVYFENESKCQDRGYFVNKLSLWRTFGPVTLKCTLTYSTITNITKKRVFF
jgi:hypothetical protein